MPTTKNFDISFNRLISHEGGYSNHPADKGGETNWGVTIAVARAHGYTGSMKLMSRDQAKEIYRLSYWQALGCENYPLALSFQLFDAGVNHGVTQARKLLQTALGVKPDGVIGSITLAALRDENPSKLVFNFMAVRLEFYTRISTFNNFGRGWVNRIAQNLRYAVGDLL
jgi:lysozyme family protein